MRKPPFYETALSSPSEKMGSQFEEPFENNKIWNDVLETPVISMPEIPNKYWCDTGVRVIGY